MNIDVKINIDLAGVGIPDSKLAREITELVRDTETPLLFHHSSRVYYWGALAGKRHELKFDPELLYAGAMFHDMGLTHQHSSADERFEVDGANAARDFLRSHGIGQYDIDTVKSALSRQLVRVRFAIKLFGPSGERASLCIKSRRRRAGSSTEKLGEPYGW